MFDLRRSEQHAADCVVGHAHEQCMLLHQQALLLSNVTDEPKLATPMEWQVPSWPRPWSGKYQAGHAHGVASAKLATPMKWQVPSWPHPWSGKYQEVNTQIFSGDFAFEKYLNPHIVHLSWSITIVECWIRGASVPQYFVLDIAFSLFHRNQI